jgi:hypothetical protein
MRTVKRAAKPQSRQEIGLYGVSTTRRHPVSRCRSPKWMSSPRLRPVAWASEASPRLPTPSLGGFAAWRLTL